MKNFNKQKGSISKIILILAGIVFVVAIVVFVAINIAGSKKSGENSAKENPLSENIDNKEPPEPVYEATIGDIKFVLLSSVDMGNYLKSSSTHNDLSTTEKFIKVTISAQNKGKLETARFGWNLGRMIDSGGRIFPAISNKAYYFLPKPDLCGAALKPEFTPVSCVRIYEVSKKSAGMKVEVMSKSSKQGPVLLDLTLP